MTTPSPDIATQPTATQRTVLRPTPRLRIGRRGLVVALWIAVSGVVLAAAMEPATRDQHMAIVAHRGDLAAGPENSLPAIIAATTSGADGIEFDVNRSSDGTWWLTHDEDLTERTSGSGDIQAHSDAELERLHLDGGLGFRPDRDATVRMVRLETVLDALGDYDGILIVDCKDKRPEGHAALARLLAERGRFTRIIARHLGGAVAIKAVDRRFTVMTLGDVNWHPDVDVWLAWSEMDVHPPLTTWADLHGGLAMFMEQGYAGRDEVPLLDNGRRWGVDLVITNDVGEALRWRDGS